MFPELQPKLRPGEQDAQSGRTRIEILVLEQDLEASTEIKDILCQTLYIQMVRDSPCPKELPI